MINYKSIYAAAFMVEFQRRYDKGITNYFQDSSGWPYNGKTGTDAWEEWVAILAHEHASLVVKALKRAKKEGRIR